MKIIELTAKQADDLMYILEKHIQIFEEYGAMEAKELLDEIRDQIG